MGNAQSGLICMEESRVTDQQKQAIQQDAERAAREGYTPNERCPHPFASEQGALWVEAYWAIRNPVEQTPAVERRVNQ